MNCLYSFSLILFGVVSVILRTMKSVQSALCLNGSAGVLASFRALPASPSV